MKRSRHLKISVLTFATVFLLLSCEREKPVEKNLPVEENPPAKTTPVIHWTRGSELPHDSTSFTEGFLFHNQQLFESTGSPEYLPQTHSLFGPVDLKTGKIEKKAELDRNRFFGEGIAFINGKIIQLTYRTQIAFIYDEKTYRNLGQFSYYSREGWGLTTNGRELIMSDGSNLLTFIDPNNYQTTKTIMVSENNLAVDYLNELEYIKGYIYANVWMSNSIVKIDPESGEVVAKMDLSDLANEAKKLYPGSLEMNGIAYDSLAGKILVTGKMWPKIYEIKFPI
jgi:glutamine cyclotransferase